VASQTSVPSPGRGRLALMTALLVPLGVGTKLYTGPGATWVVGNLGGSVYVAFWSLLVLTIRPRFDVVRVAGAVLVCTSFVEVLQRWHPPFLEAARDTLVGGALLGRHFSWIDFPFYVFGAAAVVALDRVARRQGPRPG